MIGPHFVSRNYSAQKFDFNFIVVAVEQCLANLNAFALVLFSELFLHPSYTDFLEVNPSLVTPLRLTSLVAC